MIQIWIVSLIEAQLTTVPLPTYSRLIFAIDDI